MDKVNTLQKPSFADGVNSLSTSLSELSAKSGCSVGSAFPATVTYASFASGSLAVMVMAFSYTLCCNQRKGENPIPVTRNLCGQLPLDLNQRVCAAWLPSGLADLGVEDSGDSEHTNFSFGTLRCFLFESWCILNVAVDYPLQDRFEGMAPVQT